MPGSGFFLPSKGFRSPSSNIFLPSNIFFLPSNILFLPSRGFWFSSNNYFLPSSNIIFSSSGIFFPSKRNYLPRMHNFSLGLPQCSIFSTNNQTSKSIYKPSRIHFNQELTYFFAIHVDCFSEYATDNPSILIHFHLHLTNKKYSKHLGVQLDLRAL